MVSTWDIVPGVFLGDTNEVVVATVGHGIAAGAHVPVSGEGHGSANLTIHEAFHAVDLGHGGAATSTTQAFNDARNADFANLPAYEQQAGSAGQEETYAESAARGGWGASESDYDVVKKAGAWTVSRTTRKRTI